MSSMVKVANKIDNIGLFQENIFSETSLEFLDLSLYPKKFQRKQAFTSEILQNCVTPLGKLMVENQDPWKLYNFFLVQS